MAALLRKYGTQTDLYFPVVEADEVDLAQSGDWTPATGDTKISKDGGTLANTSNNPAIVAGTNGVWWKLTLTATEMQAAQVMIQIVDSATKAIEDQTILIETYGHASALHPFDLGTATQNVNVSSISNNAITANAIASNAITSAKLAAGAITAATIATDAIDADALAADAVAEIADATGGASPEQFVAELLSSQLSEAYPGMDDEMTLAEALWAIRQLIGDFSISGTGLTVRDSNGDPAMTYVLDDADSPTSRTRNT